MFVLLWLMTEVYSISIEPKISEVTDVDNVVKIEEVVGKVPVDLDTAALILGGFGYGHGYHHHHHGLHHKYHGQHHHHHHHHYYYHGLGLEPLGYLG